MKTRLLRAFRALTLLSCLATFTAYGATTGSTGGTDPINNEQPTIQLRYIIAVQGIFPSETSGASSAEDIPMMGEIRMFAGNFVPGGWKECNGEIMSVPANTALFSIVGPYYGGNGSTTFALPDLRGRVPVGAGPGMPVGTVTGAAEITLTEGQMPAHVHSIPGANTGVSGSSAAVNNVQPSLAVTFLIAKDTLFSYMGEIRMFAGDFVPQSWLACDGQLLNINTNTALFSKLGTSFGGNGSSTFGLPDLRGRTPIGLGVGPGGATYEIGNQVGADTVTLGINQLPSHSHSTGGSATGSIGGGQSVNNMQRSLALTMAVRLEGVYPTESGGSSSQFIGDVRFFAFFPQYVVNNMTEWRLAEGNVLSFTSGDAYPLIVGTLYGGNGNTTAGAPEGRGRAVKGASSSAGMATLTGTPHYTLSQAQMPAHTHTVALVSFSAATYSVNQGATDVALTLNRTDTTTAASITVVTDDGSASTIPPFSPAVAPTDYTDLVGTAGVADFAIGESTKTIHVTLIPKTPATTPNKRFVATLAYPNALLPGDISTATIQILANDTMLPTLTLTAPAAPAGTATSTNVSATSPFIVKGVAGDAKGVARVEVVLNSAAPVNAVLGSATSNAAVPYSLSIVPLAGANTLVVTSFDLRGNSKTISRNFNFTQRYNLTLGRVAPVALDTAGTLTLAATPGTAASALTPTTANANPKTTTIVPGTTVKLTATAKVGYFFSHWDYAPSGATYVGNALTFTMPASDVPAVVANFVANPFFAPTGAGNAFHGLIHATIGATPSNSTEGYFTGTLSPSNGLFTGKVLINGLSQSFIFYFYGNGYGQFNVGTTKQETLAFGGKSLAFYYDDSADAIYATVDHNGGGGASVSTGEATRTIYSTTNKVPSDLLNQTMPATAPAPNKGFFTVGFPSKEQSPPMDPTTYPQGDSFATVTVTDVGLVSLAGTLADGTAITGSSAVVFGNQCPIWVQLVTPGAAAANKGGSFGGVLTFNTSPTDSDVTGVDLTWFRPTVTALTTPATAAAATNLYTAGWPAGIRVDAVGALYNKDATVQAGLAIGSPNALYGNARLDFTSGKLVPEVTKTNFNISANAVTKIPTSDGSFTLSLMPATGGFSGLFTPTWASPSTVKPAYKGILIQKGASRGGYGFFLSNAKNDLDPESGAVYLGAQ